MTRLTLAPLTPEGFAPFGDVFLPGAATARIDHVARLENHRPAAAPNLFLARSSVIALPYAVERLESHPRSSQTFAPFDDAPMVIAVASPDASGQPDRATMRAFIARAQGFSYRAGIWHLPVASLERPAPILGFMYEDGSPQDCVWATIEATTLHAA